MTEKICLTPGTKYGVGADEFGTVYITINIPKAGVLVKEYILGHFAISKTAKSKFQRYEQSYAERDRILAEIHDALEPEIAKLYRTIWELGIAGKTIDGEVMPATYDEYLQG